jgi:tetratricopeptide (TPR) repeat protein
MRLKLWLLPLVLGVVVVSVLAWDWYSVLPAEVVLNPQYVGQHTCAECHQTEHNLWIGSDHQLAMALATEESVVGDFNNTSFEYQGVTTRFFRRDGKYMVNTEGPDGEYHDYVVKYTFGVRPLQQYMVEFPDGRVQVLRESWDVRNKKWFYVTPPDVVNERIRPGDPLHWTGIAQNWNTTCADCHSTNLNKNYDPKTNTYHTTFTEINVSCEECHGPGSVHVQLARRWSPFWDRNIGYGLPPLKNKELSVQLDTCAKCHSRRYQVHEDFRPGRPLLDYYEPVLLAAGVYEADGQILDEDYEYGSFRQSKMYANHVRCTDCHNPHSLKLKFPGNALCTQCHEPHDPAKFDTPAHHHHKEGSAGAQCIACHMASRLYMVIDERRDHSFRIPRPDLSVALGTPNACNDCHKKPDETFEWAADAVRKWYGDKRPNDPHWGPALHAAQASKPEGENPLLDLLSRRSTPAQVRATAIELLANYASIASVTARRDALKDSDPAVRLAAVRSLPNDNEGLLAADLAPMLNDPLRAVRIAAASRLARVPNLQLTDSQRTAFDKAMDEFLISQKLTLDHAGGHLSLASLDREQVRLAQAIEHLETAIKLEPYIAGPRTELASLLEERTFMIRILLADTLGPRVALAALLQEQVTHIRSIRETEAGLLERDTKLAPNNAGIFYQLGLLRYTLDEYDQAEAAFLKACEKAPRDYEYRMALALLQEHRYNITGDEELLKRAAETLHEMNQLEPRDPRAQLILQRMLETRAKFRSGNGNPPPK